MSKHDCLILERKFSAKGSDIVNSKEYGCHDNYQHPVRYIGSNDASSDWALPIHLQRRHDSKEDCIWTYVLLSECEERKIRHVRKRARYIKVGWHQAGYAIIAYCRILTVESCRSCATSLAGEHHCGKHAQTLCDMWCCCPWCKPINLFQMFLNQHPKAMFRVNIPHEKAASSFFFMLSPLVNRTNRWPAYG